MRLLQTALIAALAGTFGQRLAQADVYTWFDASGSLNVSNLAPPPGVKVTSVIRASPPSTDAREAAAREALREAEVQVLAQQVRQLQEDVDQARREPPMQVEYRTIPAPPAMPYGADWVAPPTSYPVDAGPQWGAGCGFSTMDCGMYWAPALYPANVVLLSPPNVRRFNPAPGRHRMAPPRPVHMAGGPRSR